MPIIIIHNALQLLIITIIKFDILMYIKCDGMKAQLNSIDKLFLISVNKYLNNLVFHPKFDNKCN